MGLQDVMNNSVMNELECYNKIINPEFRNNNERDLILELFNQISNETYLKDLAMQSADIRLRTSAVDKINDKEILREVLVNSVSQTLHYHIALKLNDNSLWLELFFRNYEWCDFSPTDPSCYYKTIINQLKGNGYFKDPNNRDEFIKAVKKNLRKPYLEDPQLPVISLPRLKQYQQRDYRIEALESRREEN